MLQIFRAKCHRNSENVRIMGPYFERRSVGLENTTTGARLHNTFHELLGRTS